MKYSASETQYVEKLPDAPLGNYTMKCVFERPSKDGTKHSFLFKNSQYQIWFNCFPSQLRTLAEKFLVPLASDGSIETALFKEKEVHFTVEEITLKNGNLFKTCTNFQIASDAEIIDTDEIPF